MKERLVISSLLLAVGLVLAGPVAAAGTGGHPALPLDTLRDVPQTVFPALDREALRLEDSLRWDEGGRHRFAIGQDVALTPQNSGAWVRLDNGDRLWRLRLACPGALSLNLGFTRYHLPTGAELRYYTADGRGPGLRFDSRDNRSSGQLWTPILAADAVVVELQVPAVGPAEVDLLLGRVGCGYRPLGEDPADKSGTCNIDVVCEQGDDWRQEIPAIGMYSVNGTERCTGVMVNNTAEDGRDLFLTANHCPVSATSAPSVVIYWNFESPSCGEQGNGDTTQFSEGTTLLAAYSGSDFKLLELDESPDPAYGVAYLGWDRRDYIPAGGVCIHHPSTDEKSISFEDDPLSVSTYLLDPTPGDGTHLRVDDWDLGTTEGGSSGSPLMDPTTHRIVGQLHGGYAACGNNEPDWFGRLHVSWEGGGTPETRLRDWLDPTGSGTAYLDRLGYVLPEPEPGPLSMSLESVGPNPFVQDATVRYSLSAAADVRIRIMNMHGRPVRDYGTNSGETGTNTVLWNGLDDDGRPVPAGLYFLFLECGGEELSVPITRLR